MGSSSVFVVAYDIVAEGTTKSQSEASKAVIEALNGLSAKHVALSTWTVKTTMTHVQLRDRLKSLVRAQDRVFVGQLSAMAWSGDLLEPPHTF